MGLEVPLDRDGSFDAVDEKTSTPVERGGGSGAVAVGEGSDPRGDLGASGEIYAAEVCKATISTITNRVIEGMTA